MLRYDNHVHMNELAADPDKFLKLLEAGGMTGANVISVPPTGYIFTKESADYEERIQSLLAVTKDHSDRLFPILFIHPDEDGILSKIEDAAGRGVLGYKMICSDYYVYEEKSMRVLEKIAQLDKPVLFHSGILWDGKVSSAYNKPINWECCLDIPGLRFTLAHCSWPWIDECIALYGKLRAARRIRPDASCQMFIDITPGTPDIYRKELMTKLHLIGYELDQAVLFGSDNRVQYYDDAYTREICRKDNAIYDELGISEAARENIYGKNLLKFLGINQ